MRFSSLVLLTTGFLLACSGQSQQSENNERATEVAIEAPPETINVATIELVDLEGTRIRWEDLRGKTVFLNLWATWCKPCIMEMPSMDKAFQALGDENFVFLAASYEEPEKIRAFREKHPFSFSFVHMKSSLESLNVYSIPTTLIINQEGELVKTIVGSQPWDQPEMLNALKQIG